MPKPIKRHIALQPLSRDHHHGLLLSWKIRTGLARQVETARIKRYVDWFYRNHLIFHFEMEENNIFPLLGENHEMVRRALAEHGRLKELFESDTAAEENLLAIERTLEEHIRFEERVLFNEIQQYVSTEQLQVLEGLHTGERIRDDWEDEFWKA